MVYETVFESALPTDPPKWYLTGLETMSAAVVRIGSVAMRGERG